MRKLFISSLFIFIFLAGCSNDEAYNNAIQKGLDYIASEEYQKAESAFELALDEKNSDEKATALLEQTVYYQEAVKAMEEGDLDIPKEKAEEVIKIEDGSSALVKKSKDIVASIKDFETTLAELTEEYEVALKKFESKEYKEANKTVDNILKKELEHPIFKTVKKDVEKLQKDIESALNLVKKAEEDSEKKAEEKEKAEQEEIAKEKTATEKRPTKYDLELNPVQDGFYNGKLYMGDIGMSTPDQTHTVEEAREMGYEVIVIDFTETGAYFISELDKPYPYDRFAVEHFLIERIEGRTYEFNGQRYQFDGTEIDFVNDINIAWFSGEDGTYLDLGF